LPPARAIAVIRDEHRSLAAVLHAWMQALAAARTAGTVPEAVLMRAICATSSASRSRCTTPRRNFTCSRGCASGPAW
jgi:hypothetical protein